MDQFLGNESIAYNDGNLYAWVCVPLNSFGVFRSTQSCRQPLILLTFKYKRRLYCQTLKEKRKTFKLLFNVWPVSQPAFAAGSMSIGSPARPTSIVGQGIKRFIWKKRRKQLHLIISLGCSLPVSWSRGLIDIKLLNHRAIDVVDL